MNNGGLLRAAWRWSKRIAAGLFALLLLIAIAGALYQWIASAADARAYPPAGRLVEVGGFKLHIYCIGTAKPGWPTVILEAGLAEPSPAWRIVQTESAKTTRTCAYDRAGIGWSEASSAPRDAVHIAKELRSLLDRTPIEGPVVLAAHSSGGLYVRAFQRLYPERVAGMVLIDTTPEGFAHTNARTRADFETAGRSLSVAPPLATIGVIRLVGLCRNLPADFPADARDAYRALCEASKSWPVEREEHVLLPAPLPGGPGAGKQLTVPLVVLTSGNNVKDLPVWGPLQDRLARLSSNSRHVVLAGASHASFLIDQKIAAETANAIICVAAATVTGRSLGGCPLKGAALPERSHCCQD